MADYMARKWLVIRVTKSMAYGDKEAKVVDEFGLLLMGEFGIVEGYVVKVKYAAKMGETEIIVESVNVIKVKLGGEIGVDG